MWQSVLPIWRLAAYPVVLVTSTFVVQAILRRVGRDQQALDPATRDTGSVIGKLENLLVLTFIFAKAYTALALVFAAKSLVRIEDTESEDSTYYLAGTLANFTWSVIVAAFFNWVAIAIR